MEKFHQSSMLRCRGSFRIFLDGDLDLGLNGGLFDVIDLRGQVITGRPVSLRDAFSDICFLFYCTLLRLAKERRQDAARPTKRATSKAELFQKSRIRKNPMKEKLFARSTSISSLTYKKLLPFPLKGQRSTLQIISFLLSSKKALH